MAYDNSVGWTGWDSRGGYLITAPAISSWAPGRLDIFALGGDHSMQHLAFDWSFPSGWQDWGWDALGGYLTSPPAAVSWGSGRIDVFAVGGDNAMQHLAWDAQFCTTWCWDSAGQGGDFKYAPAVSSWGSGRLDVFAVGRLDNVVAHKSWEGGWSSWLSVADSQTNYAPAAVSSRPNRIDLLTIGRNTSSLRYSYNLR
jgi:hypothetical protein